MSKADDTQGGARAASLRREILGLAVPAFATLLAEPLFLLTDAAVIGHLDVTSLAGFSIASTVLSTLVGLFVFLAYATTGVVARRLGAGDGRRAVEAGVDGLWLAAIVGVGLALVLGLGAHPLAAAFGASDAVTAPAVAYLRVSALGVPAMLAGLAVTGVLRGLQDTRTPLLVATIGFPVNAGLNLLFVHGFHWGVAGSAWGTVIAQTGMAVALVTVLLRAARERAASLRPAVGPILAASRTGMPLLIRTLALRGALVATTAAATRLGEVPLAAYQVAATIWLALALALDALAIAAQALTGRDLGAGDTARVRATTATLLRWGVGGGLVFGLALAAAHRVLPAVFSNDLRVREAVAITLLVVAASMVPMGVVDVLDGILIGAGDGAFLAWGMAAATLAYLPLLGAVLRWPPAGDPARTAWLFAAFTGFLVLRMLVLLGRARGDRWLVTGADH